mgnify:CR=1 FL=1
MATKNTRSDAAVAVDQTAAEAVEAKSEPTKISAKEIDVNQYVPVKNGFNGILVYKSKHTGETYIWEELGDEQEIELIELKRAKSSSKRFFVDNWFMFDDDYMWVVDYLGMSKYYKNAIRMEDLDEVLQKSEKELKEIVPGLSSGQKKTMAYRARQMIADGEIDSLGAIKTLQELLGVDLIEQQF